jgi:hypothetical protein
LNERSNGGSATSAVRNGMSDEVLLLQFNGQPNNNYISVLYLSAAAQVAAQVLTCVSLPLNLIGVQGNREQLPFLDLLKPLGIFLVVVHWMVLEGNNWRHSTPVSSLCTFLPT